jgi:hypothetical protein
VPQWNQSDSEPFPVYQSGQRREEQFMATSSKARKRPGASYSGSYGIFEDVLAMAGSLANSRRDYAAGKLETFAESVRECAGAMSGIPNLKAYAGAAAESLEGLAGYVTESDLQTMAIDAREFARRHPLATLAGSIAAGVIATQMMQSRTAPLRQAAKAAGRGRRRTAARRAPANA